MNIEEAIRTIPIVLDINNPEVEEVGNYYLPYSTGIEIECEYETSPDYSNVPYLIKYGVSSSEQRFRIPAGIKGLHSLYYLSLELKKQSLLNKGSGNHYHIDFSNSFDKFKEIYDNTIKTSLPNYFKNFDWVLDELDTWNYKGTYNRRAISYNKGNWVAFRNTFQTIEFRIGEMTFDYMLLFKRISHLNKIVEKIQSQVERDYIIHKDVRVAYVNDDINEILKNRLQ